MNRAGQAYSQLTEIIMKATPEVIATAVATALEADRIVWISEVTHLRGNDTRYEIRLILRNP